MYKLLLSLRYLRSRYIALASIISVTLGVATLIVVNSVMSGFSAEMKSHLHGILSDIEVAEPGMGEINANPQWVESEVRKIVGDDLKALTHVVRVPAMLHINWRGRMINTHVMLIGVDEKTYSEVSDFRPYLLNEHLRENVSFQLQEDGYAEQLGMAGWEYRRQKFAFQKEFEKALNTPLVDHQPGSVTSSRVVDLPSQAPSLPEERMQGDLSDDEDFINQMPRPTDQYAARREEQTVVFDPTADQHIGIILGVAISSQKFKDATTGEVIDSFLAKPGDDVQVTFPTIGTPPKPVTEICTIVDFYESKMHKYDSSFAFVPIHELQKARMMMGVDGSKRVSAIQIKLKEGADLEKYRDKLLARFPPATFGWNIQTWRDTQRPLLAAAELELTILNILLFLIITVAGFGILATFFMIVVEKTKDIGVLKSLGAPSTGVASIFLSYGLSLGAVGSGVGIVAGLLFVKYINQIADFIAYVTGREVFDPTIYYFTDIPTLTSASMIIWVAIGATLIAVAASVLPAIRAARLHPVEALRYE